MHAEREITARFLKTRSEDAFRALYRSLTPNLYRTALYLSRHDQYLAEESLQETWVIGIAKLPDFRWQSTLKTWLTGIMINVIRDKEAKVRRHTVLRQQMPDVQEAEESQVVTAYDLKEAINNLPKGYQEVVVLHDIEGYKHKEIADLLSISEGTSKSQLYQARKALRNYLKDKNTNVEYYE